MGSLVNRRRDDLSHPGTPISPCGPFQIGHLILPSFQRLAYSRSSSQLVQAIGLGLGGYQLLFFTTRQEQIDTQYDSKGNTTRGRGWHIYPIYQIKR